MYSVLCHVLKPNIILLLHACQSIPSPTKKKSVSNSCKHRTIPYYRRAINPNPISKMTGKPSI